MKKEWLFVFIFILVLILLIRISWQIKEVREILPKIKEIKIEGPDFKIPITEKEFLSPDGKLKIKYSSDWIELENLNENIFYPFKEGEILLCLLKLRAEKMASAFFIAEKFEEEKIEEFLQKMEENEKINFLNLEKGEKEIFFKGRKLTEEEIFFLEGKIILNQNKIYRVFGMASENFWPLYEEEVEKMINSIHLVE